MIKQKRKCYKKLKVQIAIIRVTEVVWPKPTVGRPMGQKLRLKLILISRHSVININMLVEEIDFK